jgi:hypothetical protein
MFFHREMMNVGIDRISIGLMLFKHSTMYTCMKTSHGFLLTHTIYMVVSVKNSPS